MMPTNEAIGLVVAIVLLLSVVAGPTMKHVAGGIVMALVLAVGMFGVHHLLDGGSAKTGENFHLAAGVVGGGVWDGGRRVVVGTGSAIAGGVSQGWQSGTRGLSYMAQAARKLNSSRTQKSTQVMPADTQSPSPSPPDNELSETLTSELSGIPISGSKVGHKRV